MINPIEADKIISGILESPNESKSVEFKPSVCWPDKIDGIQQNNKVQEIIKSILAMSNNRDGGKIILGIKRDNEGKYILQGMTEDDLKTYDQDLIFEHVRNFGEPEPKFQVLNIEYNNKNFIVFAIQSFIFAPIICKNHRNLNQLEHAAVYIRTDKPETKKITDPSEMREMIDLAIEKELDVFSVRIQRIFKPMSYYVEQLKIIKPDEDKFIEELKDINFNNNDIIKKIKSRGYWEINIRPDIYNPQRIKKEEIKNIFRSALVELRGEIYPSFIDIVGSPNNIQNGIERFVNHYQYIEFWRFTQSANFYQLFAIKEDWVDGVHKKCLNVIETLFTLTEIIEFAKRLTTKNIFDDKVVVEIKLYDLNNRILIGKYYNYYFYNYKATTTEPWSYKRVFYSNDLTNKENQIIIESYLDLIYLFNWENPPVDLFKDIISKFLKAKI